MADDKRSDITQFTVGEWRIDGNALTATRGSEKRQIEPRAWKVLCYLVERPGRLVTIDELMDAHWAGAVVTPNAVTRVIAHLRKVLDDDAKNPRYIETVARTGYRFVVAPADPPATRRPRRFWIAGAAGALLAVALGWWLLPASSPTAPSIAVLPFDNLTGDPSQDYLGDGIAEEIIGTLTGLPDILVSARTESFRFRESGTAIVDIARDLGVAYVVTGSVRRNNNDIRVTAQLIDPETGNHLWSTTDERDMAQLFDGQDAVSRGVARALVDAAGLDTTASDAAIRYAPDPAAYELYMRGRYIWHRRGIEDMQPAIDMLAEAVDIDPDFAKAWSALAMAYLTYPSYSSTGYRTWHLAEDAARKAVELDPDLAASYAVLAPFAYTDYDWIEAESLYQQAIRKDPRDATARFWYSEMLHMVGHTNAAATELRRSIELDPTYQAPRQALAFMSMDGREYELGKQRFVRHWQNGNKTPLTWAGLFIAAISAGDHELALETIDESPYDDTAREMLRRFVAADQGVVDDALGDELREFFWSRPDYTLGFWTSARLGRHDVAFALANARLDRGWHLEIRPFWSPSLHIPEQPEFLELADRLGLVDYWEATSWPAACRRVQGEIDCDTSRIAPELIAPLVDFAL